LVIMNWRSEPNGKEYATGRLVRGGNNYKQVLRKTNWL
jgi:hypothetical protein